MSFLVFLLSMALLTGAFLAERELTRNARKYPWLHRVEYINRPAVIGFAMLGLGLLVWALPPHCDGVVGAGGIGVLFGCWVSEMRKLPIERRGKDERFLKFLQYVHPRG